MNVADTIFVLIVAASYIGQVVVLDYRWRKFIKHADKRFDLRVVRLRQLYEVQKSKSV